MKKLIIGNKSLSEITANDLKEIVIIEGCCPAITYNGKEIWDEPEIIDFNNTMFSDTVFLDYVSYRKSDNLKSDNYTFFFDFKNFRCHYTRDYENNKNQPTNGKNVSIDTIKFLLKKGYDIPIY